ncbi:methyltransferase [Paenibacillus illinoisensis]|uniref:methyltransferase n=1 Tax=Paenibacillus illinoisensis TaxID=59845 RepID=UPI000FD813CC|nr:methyltransferase [Paenibacillus illinoisensis]
MTVKLTRNMKKFISANWKTKMRYLKKLCFKLPFVRRISKKVLKRRTISALKSFDHSVSDSVIFMFSGTHYIKNFEGNRPIHLTREFLNKGHNVFFSYWRWDQDEKLPTSINPMLFQSPIDLTIENLDLIIKYPLSHSNKIFIISFPHPSCARILTTLKSHGWRIVYDIRDDWEEFHKVGQAIWYDKNIEHTILKEAHSVLAVSQVLANKLQPFSTTKITLSPNALSPSFNQLDIKGRHNIRKDNIIGYIGHLTESWFDWKAFLKLAKRNSDWSFEIVGHSLPEDISFPDNVKYLGFKNHDEIIQISMNWKAAIIPFKTSALSDAVDPIKVYEYLALRLPVVSFRMPQIEKYPYVYVSHNLEEFEINLRRALQIAPNENVIREFLEYNLWEQRAQQFLCD